MSVGLPLYRVFSRTIGLALPRILARRARSGKEDPGRAHERLGLNLPPRPDGVLIWLHGASVGETLVNMTVARALVEARPDASILLTSHTLTSARLVSQHLSGESALPIRHAFAPIDTPRIAKRFVAHWRPDLALFCEGEIWPNLITALDRNGAAIGLINARMTEKTLGTWHRWSATAMQVFGKLDIALAASDDTARGLERILGRPVEVSGNLKSSAPPLPVDSELLNRLRQSVGSRNIWLAGSTHPGEETFVSQAMKHVRDHPLLILAPRHPERAASVEAELLAAGWHVARRTRDEHPDAETDIYLADTLGEMGLWIRLADAVFLGGATADGIGGHNPLEVVKLERPLSSGPHVFNFDAIFTALTDTGAAQFVETPTQLAAFLEHCFAGDWQAPDLSDVLRDQTRPLDITMAHILAHLPRAEVAGA